jgi:hypothetical protein
MTLNPNQVAGSIVQQKRIINEKRPCPNQYVPRLKQPLTISAINALHFITDVKHTFMEANVKPKILLCEPERDKAEKQEAFLLERNYGVTCIAGIDQLSFENGRLITYGFDGNSIDIRLGDYVIALFDGTLQGDRAPDVWAIIPWLIQMGIPCLAIGSTEEQRLMMSQTSFSITQSDFESFVEEELPAIYAEAIAIRN